MSEAIRAERARMFGVNRNDDLAGPHVGNGGRSRKLLGMPRRVTISLGVLLLLTVAFLAIGLPILKTTVWKNGVSADGSSSADDGTAGAGSSEGSGPNKPSQKWLDADTPEEARTRKMEDGSEYVLIFSDEFNQDGRSFQPGQDKRWEGMDLHYWQTWDYERYHPDQATTKDGKLQIRLEEKQMGDQKYASAMLQTWNNFCYRGGYLEARVSLPGHPRVAQTWPAVWTMGNLGRAGYGASTDGLWPYSYDTCDVGVTANQSSSGLSWLSGQRLNKCLCSDQDTPSPGVGRGAAEIDLIEGAAGDAVNYGTIAQSHQFAPFDADYRGQEQHVRIFNATSTYWNTFRGNNQQQSVSVITRMEDRFYEGRDYQTFAFDYEPGTSGYVNWYMGGEKKWGMTAATVGPNSRNNIGQRVISEEPMYLIINLAMSDNFGKIDFSKVRFPATMYVDYIRVYQHPDRINVGCDPKDRPTAQYIKDHPKLYQDASLRTFKDAGYETPRYSLTGKCNAS